MKQGDQFVVELTDELKEKLTGVCDKVIDILTRETASPAEAFIALQFVRDSLEELVGFRLSGKIEGDDA
jgi:hypothetical protein